MADIPKIEVMLMNQPERGVIGIGEPPTISTAAAIANAVGETRPASRCRSSRRSHRTRCFTALAEREKTGGTP